MTTSRPRWLQGRKLPLAKVRDEARGRVWSGADAKPRGLVDTLGGFWTAAGVAAQLAGVPVSDMTFRIYPRRNGPSGPAGGDVRRPGRQHGCPGRVESLMNLPPVRAILSQASSLPAGGPGEAIELRAANLPRP